jgi:hypothetical protein
MKQVYDADGTTHFEFTFDEWYVKFAQGVVSISNCGTGMKVEFPEEEHWTYTGRFTREEDGDRVYCSFIGAEIKNNHFRLAVSLGVEEGEPYDDKAEATLQLEAKGVSVDLFIPGKLGLRLMCFMAGSTKLDGISNVFKE